MRGIAFSRLLLLIALIPALALAVFAGRLTYESWKRYDNLTSANPRCCAWPSPPVAWPASPFPAKARRRGIFVATGDKAKLAAAARHHRQVLSRGARGGGGHTWSSPRDDRGPDQGTRRQDAREFIALRPKIDDKSTNAAAPHHRCALVAISGLAGIDLIGSASALASDAVLAAPDLRVLCPRSQFSEGALKQRGAGQMIFLQEGKAPQGLYLLLTGGATSMRPSAGCSRTMRRPRWSASTRRSTSPTARSCELRDLALKNSGTAASEAQVKRWLGDQPGSDRRVDRAQPVLARRSHFGRGRKHAQRCLAHHASLSWRDHRHRWRSSSRITLMVLRTVRGLLSSACRIRWTRCATAITTSLFRCSPRTRSA